MAKSAVTAKTLPDSTFLVDTNVILEKADKVSGAILKVEEIFHEIQAIMDGTSGYWAGEAADLHRKMFTDKKREMETILNRLKEHPENLRLMAMNYEEAEKSAIGRNQKLQDNYI